MGVRKSDSSDLWTFDTNVTQRRIRKSTPVLEQTYEIVKTCRGGATYLHKAFELLSKTGKVYDNIIVISDYQCYKDCGWGRNSRNPEQGWRDYKNDVAPEAKLFSIDVVGYNKGAPFSKGKDDTFFFSGWSEKILEMIGSSSVGLTQEIEEWNPFD